MLETTFNEKCLICEEYVKKAGQATILQLITKHKFPFYISVFQKCNSQAIWSFIPGNSLSATTTPPKYLSFICRNGKCASLGSFVDWRINRRCQPNAWFRSAPVFRVFLVSTSFTANPGDEDRNKASQYRTGCVFFIVNVHLKEE